MICVLDAGPMVALTNDEPGAESVEKLLLDPGTTCVSHAINLCEVFYGFYRVGGETEAQRILRDLYTAGVQLRADMDEDFWQDVARLKSRGRISVADCICIALTIRLGAELVTTDHHEFDALVPLNLCPIRFIR